MTTFEKTLLEKTLKEFFDAYAARTNAALKEPPQIDAEGAASAFADCFVGASPTGVTCGKNDDEFRQVIPKGYAFYRSVGTQRMDIVNLAITPLDAFHAQAKVHWVAKYLKKDDRRVELEFDVIYFVQMIGDGPKIFAFITGDEDQAYKDNGLVPSE